MLISLCGWLGALTILFLYFLNLFSTLNNVSIAYKAMNAIGSALLIYNALETNAYPFILINGLWLIISLISLFKPDK